MPDRPRGLAGAAQWLNTPVFREPTDAPNLGGFRGFLNRFGTGFRQGVMPTRAQLLTRGLNPFAYGVGGLAEGLGDAVRGSAWVQNLFGPRSTPGGQLPSWMQPGAPMPPQQAPAPYQPNWPGAGTWPGSGNPYYGSGQGMLRPRSPYNGNRGGTQGTTIATGRAAQDMYEGMRDAARQGVLDQALREARQRAEGILQ